MRFSNIVLIDFFLIVGNWLINFMKIMFMIEKGENINKIALTDRLYLKSFHIIIIWSF